MFGMYVDNAFVAIFHSRCICLVIKLVCFCMMQCEKMFCWRSQMCQFPICKCIICAFRHLLVWTPASQSGLKLFVGQNVRRCWYRWSTACAFQKSRAWWFLRPQRTYCCFCSACFQQVGSSWFFSVSCHTFPRQIQWFQEWQRLQDIPWHYWGMACQEPVSYTHLTLPTILRV